MSRSIWRLGGLRIIAVYFGLCSRMICSRKREADVRLCIVPLCLSLAVEDTRSSSISALQWIILSLHDLIKS